MIKIIDEPDVVLTPIGPGGAMKPGGTPIYLQEIISKLNSLFGEATPLKDQAAFVNQVIAIARENKVVMAQVQSDNTREQVLKGNLPGAVQAAVVREMTSHKALATLLLKADKQSMSALTDVVYDLLNRNTNIDFESIGI